MAPLQKGLIGAVIAIGLAVSGFLMARHWQSEAGQYERIAGPAECDLRSGPCRVDLDDGNVVFAIAPAAIPLMQTLTLSVETSLPGVESVVVDIRGLNMDMGLNRTRLQPREAADWSGETILPVCSSRRMEWEAAVQLTGARALEIPFNFATMRP